MVRASAEQMTELARVVVDRINQAQGPAAVAIPQRGWSFYNREGLIFFDPAADQAYVEFFEKRSEKGYPGL